MASSEITVEQVRAQLQALGHSVPDDVIQGFLLEMDPVHRPGKDEPEAAGTTKARPETTYAAGAGRTTGFGRRVMAPRPVDISASFGEDEDTVVLGDNSELFHTWDEDDFMSHCAQPLSYPTALGSPKREVFVPHKPAPSRAAKSCTPAPAPVGSIPTTTPAPRPSSAGPRRSPLKDLPVDTQARVAARQQTAERHAAAKASSSRQQQQQQESGSSSSNVVVAYEDAYAPTRVISSSRSSRQRTPEKQRSPPPHNAHRSPPERYHHGGTTARPSTAPSSAGRPYSADLNASMMSTRSVRSLYQESARANSSFIAMPSQQTRLARKKVDRVARYGEMQQSWKGNGTKYLSGAKKRPTPNFHSYFAQQHAAAARDTVEAKARNRRESLATAPVAAYVPPQDKRRDNLRWQVRCRMQHIDTCEPVDGGFNLDDSVWEP